MPTDEDRYFFSYARKDSGFVQKLAEELRFAGVNLWLDQLDILGGDHWDRAVENALQTCEGMILVLSADSVNSNNVMDEVSYALGEGKRIIPVLCRDCEVPFRLRRIQHIDFTGDYEKGFNQLLSSLGIKQDKQTTDEETSEQQKAETDSDTTEKPLIEDIDRNKTAENTRAATEETQNVNGKTEPAGSPIIHEAKKRNIFSRLVITFLVIVIILIIGQVLLMFILQNFA